jgi:hypothetical protein
MSSKLREALEDARHLLMNIDFDEDSDLDDMAAPVVQKISEALAEPVRNCDVGTEYEQSERLAEFCRHHQKGCGLGYGSKGIDHPKVTCPAFKNIECSIVWAQLPYDETKGESE